MDLFDPASLTDQELLDRQIELHKKLAWSSRFSGSEMLVVQLRNMVTQCEIEYGDRMNRRTFEILHGKKPDFVDICAPIKEKPKKDMAKAKDYGSRYTQRAGRSSVPIVKDYK